VDGAAELAFQGALAIELLDEVRLAHGALVVEDLVAHGAGGRQALGRQHQPRRSHLIARHQNGRAVALHLIFDAALVERLGDGASFLQVEVGIEQGLGLAQARGDREEGGRDARADAEDGGEPSDPEPLKRSQNLVQRRASFQAIRTATGAGIAYR
jgi:hypothetical protein